MQWKIKRKVSDLTQIEGQFHPVVQVLLEERGYLTKEDQDIFLSPDYDRDTHDPFLFSQMERIVERIARARDNGEKVGIFGDFDADGVTSSVILRQAFEMLGVPFVVYLPDKISEGHGLSDKAVDFFHQEKVFLMVTLDCGMMNHTEISQAKEKGIECIIIDHHHVPEVLPDAVAIINPKIQSEKYPFKELCGAGTTFKVVQALFLRLKPDGVEGLKWLLDIVAIGTVADVMPLIGENRVWVKYGLLVLSKTRNLGLLALLEEARLQFSEGSLPDAELIAFQIAPRINAASRMAHAALAHDLLMAKDMATARKLAKELQNLNVARQKQSRSIGEEIIQYITENRPGADFLLASAPHYPYGIVGLIAGKIAHTFERPTAILTKGEETSRGSLRSIPGFSVINALEECSDLLLKYGGHEQAAGMHIENKNLAAFEERFSSGVEKWKENHELSQEKTLSIDAELTPEYVSNELFRDLKKLAPFGEGNREPLFLLKNILIEQFRRLGKKGEHIKLSLQVEQKSVDAIGFNMFDEEKGLLEGARVDVVFCLTENIWRGKRSLQLNLHDLKRV